MKPHMSDTEVENTLREIRERVRAEAARQSPTPSAEPLTPAPAQHANGHSSHPHPAGEALARLQADLATTERARTRLPPVTSYRSGLTARLELWLKRLIKRAAHWFTWEQVNFNSAAHQALADALAALGAHEQSLARAHAELAALRHLHEASQAQQAQVQAQQRAVGSLQEGVESLQRGVEFLQRDLKSLQQGGESLKRGVQSLQRGVQSLQEAHKTLQRGEESLQRAQESLEGSVRQHIAESDERAARLSSALAETESRLAGELAALARAFEAGVEQLRAEMGAHADGLRSEQQAQLLARAADLQKELRERAEQVLEEQRVCFRQLSLEASEAAVLQDRARRHVESRLEALEKATNLKP